MQDWNLPFLDHPSQVRPVNCVDRSIPLVGPYDLSGRLQVLDVINRGNAILRHSPAACLKSRKEPVTIIGLF
jgi:hypothetical protein